MLDPKLFENCSNEELLVISDELNKSTIDENSALHKYLPKDGNFAFVIIELNCLVRIELAERLKKTLDDFKTYIKLRN